MCRYAEWVLSFGREVIVQVRREGAKRCRGAEVQSVRVVESRCSAVVAVQGADQVQSRAKSRCRGGAGRLPVAEVYGGADELRC
mgnify:CR=1 FL=1